MRRVVFIVFLFVHLSRVQPGRLDYGDLIEADDIDHLKNHIDVKVADLVTLVESKCARGDSQSVEPPSFSSEELLNQVQQKVSAIEEQVFQRMNGLVMGMSLDVMRKIETLLQKVASKQDLENLKTHCMDTKQVLQELKDQNTATKQDLEELKAQNEASQKELQDLKNQVTTLVTSEALSELEERLTGLAKTTSGGVTQAIANLATKSDMDQSQAETDTQLKEIIQQLGNVTSCSHRNDFDRVLELLASADEDLDNVASAMSASLTELKATCLTRDHHHTSSNSFSDLLVQVKAAVEKNGQTIATVATGINSVETDVTSRLVTLEQLIEGIQKNTLPLPTQPPLRTTTTTTQRPTTVPTIAQTTQLSACEDSTFVGIGANQVCEAAVRFRKCQLEFLSYHCCRSCTHAGLIPEEGPHRYLHYGRSVSIRKALQFMWRPVSS